MTSFILVLIVVGLFALVLTYETAGNESQIRLKPSGLFTWLISGNWPAKVGAGLLIIGIGALLRYAFANIDVPPEVKLSSGAVIAGVIGFAAMLLRNQPKRRAIYLALGGAAFGVAYLTAYSAYDNFKYLNDVNALALLALVAVATGVFAVTSNAMSIAILAMVGAYIAPKFAISTPEVLPVYGYYLAASILSLIMVTMRGWRPLIHLSFLFTLAGAMFFGWSGKFYEPAYYSIMQPLLLALAAVHLLMPLLERKHTRSAGLARFDSLYFVLLPLVAAGLTLKIAPDIHREGALGLGALAVLWVLAAGGLHLLKQSEVSRHAIVAALLAIASLFCYAQDLPWLLLGLGLSVAAMAIGPKLDWPRNVQEFACGLACIFGALHAIHSISEPVPAQVFLSQVFAYRMIAGALMLYGGWIGMRHANSMAKILGVTGLTWVILSLLSEVLRLQLDFLPQLVYGLILGALVLCILFSNKVAAHPVVGGWFIFGLVCCGWWATHNASIHAVFAYMILTPIALLGMAWAGRDVERNGGSDFAPSMAIGLLPFALLPWASAIADHFAIHTDFVEASIAMAGIAAAGLSARLWLVDSPRWNARIQPLHVYFTAFALLLVTLFHIERGVWPVAFELMALAYLLAYVARRSREESVVGFGVGAIMVLLVTLVVQAMLLRAFGPDGIMDAADINKMHLPAVVSLVWAIFGAGLAWWGTHTKSRSIWSAGSVLLVVAAVKLVLFDFGNLGQLGNILAFIAAGVVFLGVAWFAPIPPKAPLVPERQADPESSAQKHTMSAPEQQARPDAVHPAAQPQAPSQASHIHQPAMRTADHAEAARLHAARKKAAALRYRDEPKSINWLWFVLLVFALAIALFSSAWQKQTRHREAMKQYRQQLAETSIKEKQQQAESGKAAEGNVAPATVASVQTAENDAMSGRQIRLPLSSASAPTSLNAAARPVKLVDACNSFTDRLPSDYVVYAAGAYKGREPVRQSGSSGTPGTFDVFVNVPGKNVVLALGAYDASLWKIRWSSSTSIVGIFVSGFHEQTVQNLPGDIPVLNATYESRSPCGYFYINRDNVNQTDAFMKKIFGRSAQMYSLAMNGKIDLVEGSSDAAPSRSPSAKIERYIDENGHVGYRERIPGK